MYVSAIFENIQFVGVVVLLCPVYHLFFTDDSKRIYLFILVLFNNK